MEPICHETVIHIESPFPVFHGSDNDTAGNKTNIIMLKEPWSCINTWNNPRMVSIRMCEEKYIRNSFIASFIVLSVSLDCHFLIALSVFSNVYFDRWHIDLHWNINIELFTSWFFLLFTKIWCWTPLCIRT
jgi:hypothetical protein